MSVAPKVGPLVAEFLSGATPLLLGYFLLPYPFTLHSEAGFAIPAFAILAWIAGSFLDAARNLVVESILDNWWPVEWKYLIEGERERIAAIEQHYLSFYQIDMDMTLAVVFFLVLGPLVPYMFLGVSSIAGIR